MDCTTELTELEKCPDCGREFCRCTNNDSSRSNYILRTFICIFIGYFITRLFI